MDEGDEYERKFMSEGGLVYQSKAKAPKVFHLLLLFPFLLSLTILSIVAITSPVSPAIMAAALPSLLISLPLWLLFAVLRATVTTTHVHIQYGLFGPKIPLERIQSCEVMQYDWKKYGGFGIRRGRDGSWMYNMMGDQGRAVKLSWRDDKGKDNLTLFSSSDPDGFVRAVAKAKANPAAKKVRVPAGVSEADVAAAEREIEAELEGDNVAAREAARKEAD